MSDMPTKEVLNFNKPGEIKNTPVKVDGTSALKLEPEFFDDIETDKDRDAQIGVIRKEFIKPEETQNILPLTNTDAGVQRAPRGVVGPVGNQGREVSGGDRTGGGKKKGVGVRIVAGVMAGVAAAGIGYGVFKDKINSFFGGGVDPNDLPPTYPVESPGEMPSQSENIESPTPSAEVTPEVTQSPSPEVTEAPTPIVNESEILAKKKQNFINKTNEYTYKNIKNELFCVGGREDKIYDLGLVNYDYNNIFKEVVVQGWLFNYREENGNLILEVGFDNKDNTKGVIKDVVIPIDFYQKNIESGFGLSFINYDSWQRSDSSMTDLGMRNDADSIKDQLNSFLDKPMLFEFYSSFTLVPRLVELYGEKTATSAVDLINNNSSAVNQLLTEISDNGEDIKIGNIDKDDSSALILAGVYACFK